jgi:hypothetical protein
MMVTEKPLNYKEVVLMEDNSANQKQPAPETVSVQEFAKQLDYGHWVKCSNPFSASDYRNKPTRDFSRYFQLYSHLLRNDVTLSLLQQIIAEGNPIYSRTTDPTAWLASQAEQEGVNQ